MPLVRPSRGACYPSACPDADLVMNCAFASVAQANPSAKACQTSISRKTIAWTLAIVAALYLGLALLEPSRILAFGLSKQAMKSRRPWTGPADQSVKRNVRLRTLIPCDTIWRRRSASGDPRREARPAEGGDFDICGGRPHGREHIE